MNYLNDHKNEVSMLIVPKTGYTTISKSMSENTTRDKEPKYKSFMMLRKPEDRIRSAYHEALRRRTFKGSLLMCMQELKSGKLVDNHLLPLTNYYHSVDKIFYFPNFEGLSNWSGIAINRHENKSDQNTRWCKKSLALFREIYKDEIELYKELTWRI